eukprot:12414237-Karenia_brevis.AAC.1
MGRCKIARDDFDTERHDDREVSAEFFKRGRKVGLKGASIPSGGKPAVQIPDACSGCYGARASKPERTAEGIDLR